MNNFLQKNYPFLILMALVFITRFAFLNYPSEVVFDEVYFGKFVNAYFSHEYYFDIHPPLGKMLIAGFAKISGFKSVLNFNQIGEKFNSENFLILRFLPALFGSLIPLLIYLLLLQIGASKKTAFFGSFLLVFDNALLTQSKFILLDVFLLFFGFSSLYFFVKQMNEKNYKKSLLFLTMSAALAAFSLSIKWTGISFLAIILLMFLINGIKKINLKEILIKSSILILIPFIIYYFVFWLHFQILHKSGQGDAFMSSQFQKTLIGNNIKQDELPMPNWQKFIELNKAMYYYNSSIKATHPDSSKWFQWPIDKRPVWYWTKTESGETADIHLFGNPIIWWFVLIGIIFSVFAILVKKIRQKLPPIFPILIFGYFLNLLPYIFIKRVAFLYHYLPSLIFGILILSILYEKIFAPFFINTISKIRSNDFAVKSESFFYFGFLFLCLLIFLILSPLSYGFSISPSSKLNEFYDIFIKFIS